MNKNIELTKNIKSIFIINIFILASLFIFRLLFNDLGYYSTLVNIMTLINILFLIFGIVLNILMILKKDRYDNGNTFVIMLIVAVIYVILNTLGIYLINKPIESEYKKYSDKLYEYCEQYECETYEIVSNKNNREYIIENNYLDYNNNLNSIRLTAQYNINGIYEISAIITSDNELYSENLIKEKIKDYFNYFNKGVSESLIKKAFELRFENSIKENEYEYQVTEVYSEKKLSKIKTKIIARLK